MCDGIRPLQVINIQIGLKKLVVIGAGTYGREAFTPGKQSHSYGSEFTIKGYLDSRLDALNNYKDYPLILDSVEGYEIQDEDVFICVIGGIKQRKKRSMKY